FSMKGDSEESGGVTQSFNLSYLEVPVLAKATFGPPASPISPSLFAGPSFGINLSSKAKVEGAGSGFDGEVDYKDVTKSTEVGMVFGGQVEFGNFGIDVRYNKGLTNVSDDGSGEEIKSSVFSILGSFRFF
ncbi:MAG TPA: outer membrane beta-barrel protein, partial [bacterium]|nr:outer membrane beta-barrel protein [bacterium]